MQKQRLTRLTLSLVLILAGTSWLASSATAVPAQMVGRLTKAFQKADKNQDGALTLAEAKAGTPSKLWKNFDKIDTNKSGTITLAEVVKAFENGTLKR